MEGDNLEMETAEWEEDGDGGPICTDGTEILIIPKTDISRSFVQLAPLSPLQGMDRTALPMSSVFAHYHQNSSSSFYRVSITPLRDEEILTFPQKNRLRFLYALPGHGTTSVLINAIMELQKKDFGRGKARWMSYMDLRRVVEKLSAQGLDESWTLAKMIVKYNDLTKPEMIAHIESLFEPSYVSNKENLVEGVEVMEEDGGEGEGEIVAELLLDEIDEIPLEMQQVVLSILKGVDWKRSGFRVWVASRPHLKPQIDKLIEEDGTMITSFELLPVTRFEQIEFWVSYWKLTLSDLPTVDDERLRRFSSDLLTYMEQVVSNFSKTLGSCPSHLQRLADYFAETVSKYVEDPANDNVRLPLFSFSSVKVIERLVRGRFDAYLDQWMLELPTPIRPRDADEVARLREREFRRVAKLHVKFAVATFDKGYSTENKVVFTKSASQPKHEFEVRRVGILFEMNGRMEFLHPVYAEFMLAQFFVDYGRVKSTGVAQLSFFFHKVLFHDDCKRIRKFFNDYWALQQEGNKMKKNAAWMRLRQFLTQHYFLKDEVGTGQGESGITFEDIKGSGSCLHLSLIEGNLSLYEIIVDSFRGHILELKRLLSMTVPMDIFNENPFQLESTCKPESHTMAIIHLLALFARGSEAMLERLVRNYLRIFKNSPELAAYFRDGSWTPLHYAGMSSNHDFIRGLLCPKRKFFKVDVNLKNPKGQQATHLVLASKCWYYSMKIVDHPHSTNQVQGGKSSSPQSSSSSNGTVASRKRTIKGKKVGGIINAKNEIQREIWSFEGTVKDFSEAWEQRFYPSKGKCGYLQQHFSALNILLGNGGNVNGKQDQDGKGLLHLAAAFPSPNLVKFLLDKGANPKQEDDSGKMPSYYAEVNGNIDAFLLLWTSETQPAKVAKIQVNRNRK